MLLRSGEAALLLATLVPVTLSLLSHEARAELAADAQEAPASADVTAGGKDQDPERDGEEPLEEVTITYKAGLCGDQESLIGRVSARTTRFKLSQRNPELRHFEVEIQEETEEFSGTLRIFTRDGKSQERSVSAHSCEALFDAMALMIALAIDPLAPTSALPEVEAEVIDEEEAVARPPPPPVAKQEDTKSNGELSPPKKKQKAREQPQWKLGSGGHAVVTVGAVENPLWGGQFDVNVAYERPHIFSPSGRISAVYQGAKEVPAETGGAHFHLFAASLELCPVQFRLLPRRLSLRPCLTGLLGSLAARAVDVPGGRSAKELLATLGGSGRLEVPVHKLLVLDASVGASFPERRDRFLIDEEMVSRASAVLLTSSVGATIWFR